MRIFMLAICLALAGCGGGESSEDGKEAEEDKETVFDPLIGTLDKANAVEGQLMDSKDRTDQAIAESELATDGSEEDQDD
jgi:hypothetical protein